MEIKSIGYDYLISIIRNCLLWINMSGSSFKLCLFCFVKRHSGFIHSKQTIINHCTEGKNNAFNYSNVLF